MKPLMAGLGIVGATMARRLRHGKLDAVCCNRRGLVVDVFMHDDRDMQFGGQFVGGGKVVRMGVGIEQIPYPETGLGGEREIVFNFVYIWVNDDCGTGVGTAHKIGLAAAFSGDLVKNHAIALNVRYLKIVQITWSVKLCPQ